MEIKEETVFSNVETTNSKQLLIGTAMDPFHWRRNGPTPFVP